MRRCRKSPARCLQSSGCPAPQPVRQIRSRNLPVRYRHRKLASREVAGLQIRRPRPAHLPHVGGGDGVSEFILQIAEIQSHAPAVGRRSPLEHGPGWRPRPRAVVGAVHPPVYAHPVSVRPRRASIGQRDLAAIGAGRNFAGAGLGVDVGRQPAGHVRRAVPRHNPVVGVLVQPRQSHNVPGYGRTLKVEHRRRLRVTAVRRHGILEERNSMEVLGVVGFLPDSQVGPAY